MGGGQLSGVVCYEIELRIQILGTALVGAAPGLISRCTLRLDLQATDSKAPTTRRSAPIDPSIIATAARGYGSANARQARHAMTSCQQGGRHRFSSLPAVSVGASMSAIAPGFADKPRRRWRARDDLGVVPFVVRTGVVWSGHSRM
jgi:hypothetical protein